MGSHLYKHNDLMEYFLNRFLNKTILSFYHFWGEHYFFTKQNFSTVQIESTSRQQNKCDLKIKVCLGMSRKHCGKRRKCWLPAFSPFPTMFSKGDFLRVMKSWDCVAKS